MENYGTNLYPTLSKNQDLVPWNGGQHYCYTRQRSPKKTLIDVVMLEKYWNNIPMYGCSQIQYSNYF